ncbi:diadenosine tetraphosphatase [Rhodopirellula sp. SM50]|nr:metallophosphoesterase [Rhodopirellula sp. SM50]PAY17453.1 diadenosine tetraphosphatase [Rhodopirellula sp. SM50]
MPAYDIIGDIHGHAEELKSLLEYLGYRRHGAGYRRSDRQLVFVGDFIDRGPAIAEVIAIARATVDAGDGFAAMGNHEYNAIAYHTERMPGNEDWFRPRIPKNKAQHQASLDQLKSGTQMADAITWFKTLPVSIERDGMRVVHAAWFGDQINRIGEARKSLGNFNESFFAEAQSSDTELFLAIENVLKGPELKLPFGHEFSGKGGEPRRAMRYKWYEAPAGRTSRGFHFGSDDVPDVAIEAELLEGMTGYPEDAPPVFVGHYWLTGQPAPLASNVACTDYSVAKGGKLVAYRWDGEQVLQTEKFHWVEE